MSPLVIIVSIVLIDLIGFSIVMPLLPLYARHYDFTAIQIGWLYAAYPVCQLVAGPVLGRLSDRYGRRPVLVFSQAGTALSFVILGLSSNFTVMLLARMLDGASGGNILVAQAYVADVTKPEHRARSLGLIGAAFGVGFILGPLLGGLLVKVPLSSDWKLSVPFLVAAVFSTLAWLLVVFRLPESLPADASARQAARVVTWHGVIKTVTEPAIGRLVVLGALTVFSFAAVEGTLSLFMKERLNWSVDEAMFGFAFLGFVSALVQGGLIRRLVPRFGEPTLIRAGLATLAVGLAAVALAWSGPALLVFAVVVGVGQGMASPSIQGLLSRSTTPSEQGAVFGTLNSAQTLARSMNYVIANVLLGRYGPSAPYFEASAVAVLGLIIALGVPRLAVRTDADEETGRLLADSEVRG